MGSPNREEFMRCFYFTREDELRAIAVRLQRVTNSEETAILQLKLMLAHGQLAYVLDLPELVDARFEFPVPGGRLDLLLFHADDTLTVVEAKADGSNRDIAAGIGQLCVYASLLPGVLTRQPKSIRRLLCAPVEPERAVILMRACELAGVQFQPLATYTQVRSFTERLRGYKI